MDMNPGPTEDQERSEEAGLGSFRGIGMYQRAYWQIQAILDEVLGGEISDGVGEGIVADVRLALERRYRAGREEAARDVLADLGPKFPVGSGQWWQGYEAATERAAEVARGQEPPATVSDRYWPAT